MNETLKTIHSLRSIHGHFDLSKEISASDLRLILEAAVCAATASARQTYSILVVDDQNDMKEYLQYTGGIALIFCVDYNRLTATAKCFNYEYDCGGLADFITGGTDTILAAQTAAIAAKSLGIDSLFTNSVHRVDLHRFYQKFALPTKHCFPLIALILGYAKEQRHPQRERLAGKAIFHERRYQILPEEAIRSIASDHDNPANNLGLVFKPTATHPTYMDWFFNVWCMPGEKESRRQKQDEIVEILDKAGFLKK